MAEVTKNPLISPKSSIGDAGHALARSALGAIPFAGQAGVELFSMIIVPPIEKRRDEWMLDIGNQLNKLQSEGSINIEILRENPEFIDVVLSATQSAMKTNQAEKKAAFRNAILNTALQPDNMVETKRQILIACVDTFTMWHIVALNWFSQHRSPDGDPHGAKSARYLISMPTPIEYFYSNHPQIDQEVFPAIWNDLANHHLVTSENLFGPGMGGRHNYFKRTTRLGDDLMSLIKSPNE